MAQTKKVETPKLRSRWGKNSIQAEQSTGEVITVPNQSHSIKDILFRNTAGMAYSNYKTPYYEDEATFSSQSLNKIQEMEPVEKLQYIDELSNKMDTLKESIKQHEAQKAEQVKAQAEAVQQTQNETTPSE